MTWLTGCLLLGLFMAFGFSGYLLPWNRLAYFATKVGTDIAGVVPLAGPFLLRFLRGGDEVTGATLTRFCPLGRVSKTTMPSVTANKVQSLPTITFSPGLMREPCWRTMILPDTTNSPAYFFTPRR